MRIAHLADCHLGFRQFQRLDPDGVNQRESDVAAQFRRAMDAVIARAPDLVVIAGDLFHAVRPTNRSIIEAFGQLARLRRELPRSPVVLLAGNHDTPRSLEAGSILKLMASLGVDVVDEEPRRLTWKDVPVSVLAVPHAALLRARRGDRTWQPDPGARFNVLALHPEMAGYFPEFGESDYGGVHVEPDEIADDWDYAALGHFHVQSKVKERVWYSGSLEYTSPNIWGERRLEEQRHVSKGLLLADLESGKVEAVRLPPARVIHDLPALDASGMNSAELDKAIAGRLAGVKGGIADTVTRLLARNVPRHVAQGLDHATLRSLRASALHFQLDLRRPEPASRAVGMGAPGSRSLPDMLAEYLGRRPLDADLDRARLVKLGRGYIEQVERAEAEAGA